MIVGWLGNVTIGAWFLDTGVLTISLVLLALLLARAEADPEQPMQLPFPAAFVDHRPRRDRRPRGALPGWAT